MEVLKIRLSLPIPCLGSRIRANCERGKQRQAEASRKASRGNQACGGGTRREPSKRGPREKRAAGDLTSNEKRDLRRRDENSSGARIVSRSRPTDVWISYLLIARRKGAIESLGREPHRHHRPESWCCPDSAHRTSEPLELSRTPHSTSKKLSLSSCVPVVGEASVARLVPRRGDHPSYHHIHTHPPTHPHRPSHIANHHTFTPFESP